MDISSVLSLKMDVICLKCEKTEACDFKDPPLSQGYSSSLSEARSSL